MPARTALAAALLLLLAAPGRLPAQERYYIWIFSSQSTPKLPRYTHTWATYARVADGPGPARARQLDAFTISWLPATLEIYPFRRRAEPGANFDLLDTLRYVQSQNERMSVWGPFEVPADHFARGLRQKVRLGGGRVRYQAIDPLFTNPYITDCIHAITDTDPYRNRAAYTESLFFGEAAGRHIVRVWGRSGLIRPAGEDLRWAEHALGMDDFPLVRRAWPGP